jgi:hypothetical protein
MTIIPWEKYNKSHPLDEPWDIFRERLDNYLGFKDDCGFMLSRKGLYNTKGKASAHYIALTHTWQDRAITPNSLCALVERIYQQYGDVNIWCDLMAVPRGIATRTAVINNMHSIYSEADAVLIIPGKYDKEIISQRMKINKYGIKETLMMTKWAKRVWTLQEALLAQRLWVLSEELIEVMNRYPSQEGLKRHTFLDHKIYPKSMNYWDALILSYGRNATRENDYYEGILALCDNLSVKCRGVPVPLQILTCRSERSNWMGFSWKPHTKISNLIEGHYGYYMTDGKGYILIKDPKVILVGEFGLSFSTCKKLKQETEYTNMIILTGTELDKYQAFVARRTGSGQLHYRNSIVMSEFDKADVKVLKGVYRLG